MNSKQGIMSCLGLIGFGVLAFGSAEAPSNPPQTQRDSRIAGKTPAPPIDEPDDDASLLIFRYGRPDIDDSTAYDNPRPPIVTRLLTFKKERVRAVYVVDGTPADDPPYNWKLIGFQDPGDNSVLSPDMAVARLKRRETTTYKASRFNKTR